MRLRTSTNRSRGAGGRQRGRGESGESAIWMMIVLAGLVLIVGLVFEAGRLLAVKREAERVAFEGARAGAVEVSLNSLYRGDHPYLDRDEAETVATTWVTIRGFEPDVEFHEETNNGGPRVIEVTATRQHSYLWNAFGGPVTIEASSRALAADGASASGES